MFDALLALSVVVFISITAFVSITTYLRAPDPAFGAGSSALLGRGLRSWYIAHLQPLEERCLQLGLQPSHLSFAQLAAGVLVAYCYARGLLFTAGWLMLVTGSLDIIDGRVARRTNTGSKRGAFLDSVVDRYADSFAFLGLAVYFRYSWLLWGALLGLVGGLMVSYMRARAEGLGVDCKVGLLQRPERYVILGFGSLVSTLFDRLTTPWLAVEQHFLLGAVLLFLAVLVNFTAIQRAVHVWRLLGEPPHVAP